MSQIILIQALFLLLFLMNEGKLKSSRLSTSRDRFPYHPNLNLLWLLFCFILFTCSFFTITMIIQKTSLARQTNQKCQVLL